MPEHVCAEMVPIFNHLAREELVKISSITHHRHYPRGSLVFQPGRTDHLIIVAAGRMKVYQLSSSGKEQLLRVLLPGDFIGEKALFGSADEHTYGEALTDLSACMISRASFQELLMQHPTISLKILEEYTRRLAALETQTARNSIEPVETRLALYLLDLRRAEQRDSFALPLKMRELAAFLSTSPETLSRKFRLLEDGGMIRRSGYTLTLLDPAALETIPDERLR